jgi:peptidoglycan/LPS O-acetylase OafA/YrhL
MRSEEDTLRATSPRGSTTLRQDIEGLRAVAVVAVILYHAHFLGLRGGFVGVDVFFVISGFLITTLLVNEHTRTGRISFARFYARRARRLLPASAIVIVGTVIAGSYWLEPLRLRDLGTDAVASSTFVANFVFAGRDTDYLQSTLPPSALQHFWSLSVEEQFYMVWPALLALLLWRGVRSVRRATIGILTVVAISFAIGVWQTSVAQPWAFFGLHARAWELGIGALLALSWPWITTLRSTVRSVLAWIGIVAIGVSVFVIHEGMRFPGVVAVLPVLGATFALMGGDDARNGPVLFLRHPIAQYLGSRSYSLYLWHWPILIIGEAALDQAPNPIERIGLLALAFVGAECSYRFVENPIRHSNVLAKRQLTSLSLGIALVVVGATSGVLLRITDVALSTDEIAAPPVIATTIPVTTSTSAAGSTTTTPPVPETSTTMPGPPPPVVSPTETPTAVLDGLATEKVPANLEPSLGDALVDRPELYDNGCHLDASSTTPKDCPTGDTTSAFTVALFGDSHAAQWHPALEDAARNKGWRLLSFTKSGCAPIEVITYNSMVGAVYPQCKPWREAVKAKMAEEKVSLVFVSYSNRLLDTKTRQPFPDQVWKDGFAELVPELRALGAETLVITDTPYPGRDVPICLSDNISRVQNCTYKRSDGFRESRHATNVAVAVDNGAQYLDVSNWICGPEVCPVIVGNILLYRDSNHVTTTYARWLAPLVEAAISPYVEALRQRTNVS